MIEDFSLTYLLHRLIFELDKEADKTLRAEFGISYKRALFLLILHDQGTMTQHKLAVTLGYSDPAVSTMLLQLAKEDYLTISPSPEHGRKRLVTITPKGSAVITRGRSILEAKFADLLAMAGIDVQVYRDLNERLYQALCIKTGKDIS